MLTGRESLVRLIGKRRRFLPNRDSLLCSPSPPPPAQSCLNLGIGEYGKIVSLGKPEELSESKVKDLPDLEKWECLPKIPELDWVTCPVCGKKVRGDGYTINLHLDTCLTRGTKRKLTQQTLLQLKFSPRSKIQVCANESEQATACAAHKSQRGSFTEDSPYGDDKVDDAECDQESLLDGPPRDFTCEAQMGGTFDFPSRPLKGATQCDNGVNGEDMLDSALDTFIVGRRFSDEKELRLGMAISLIREPENAKDSNAVKVLSADTGLHLGYLPRSLARFISPLLEKYHLSFEGCVTSLPQHDFDIVPVHIQIISHGMVKFNRNFDVFHGVKTLWMSALQEAECARRNPPNKTKYQQNFRLLVHEVLCRSSDLFTEDERVFMESFNSLSDDSQRLFVRLYSRKGPWFRLSNVTYPEIADTQRALEELSGKGYMLQFEFVEGLQSDDMRAILSVLTASELREMCCVIKKGNRQRRKKDLIASLLCSYENGSCSFLPSMALDRAGLCLRISSRAESVFWRAERIFFLNGEQDLSTFLLVDLGAVKFPIYNCTVSGQIFSSQSHLLAYEEAIEVAQLMDESLEENDADKISRLIMIADSRINPSSEIVSKSCMSGAAAVFLSCFTASWVYSKVILVGISFLERERRYQDSINLLKRLLDCFTLDGRRGYWTVRLSVDLEHLGYLDESLSVAEKGLLDPWVRAGSRMALQKRILRLGKPPRRWKIPSSLKIAKWKIKEVRVRGRPLNCEMGKKSRFYGEDGEQCGVEQLALQYYAGTGGGWDGVHTESGIWLTIFGLLMWDIIFSDIPNVFCTKFQTAPLDLETDSFYLARKAPIESHLQKIHDGLGEEILIASWESHVGTACRGVNWDRHTLLELRAAVACVGGPCLASLCRLLSQDYRSWSSGMPDLLLWRFHGEIQGEAKLVEVKGPNDKLSEQQRAWLFVLMDCGFNVEVCKVAPSPD